MTKITFEVTSYLITAVATIWSVICNATLQLPETGAFSSAEKSLEMTADVWKEIHLLLEEKHQTLLALNISRRTRNYQW